jgi:NRPS condensation-like uncharacterized protein
MTQKTQSTISSVDPGGPQKEKVQFTIRIDKELMDRLNALREQTGMGITDIVARGLILAMQEQDQSGH